MLRRWTTPRSRRCSRAGRLTAPFSRTCSTSPVTRSGIGRGRECSTGSRGRLVGCFEMPIQERNKHRYPPNWRAIVEQVRSRSGDCCEGSPLFPDCRAENGKPHPVTGSKVVLTTAHLEDPIENCELSNLKHWCQRCHLRYDAKRHVANRARNRLADLEEKGQVSFIRRVA